jgi:hypothetical protein
LFFTEKDLFFKFNLCLIETYFLALMAGCFQIFKELAHTQFATLWRVLASVWKSHVLLWNFADDSEEPTGSIFMVEEKKEARFTK